MSEKSLRAFGCRAHALIVVVFCLSPLTEHGGFGWWQFVAAFVVAFGFTSVVWGEWDWVLVVEAQQ